MRCTASALSALALGLLAPATAQAVGEIEASPNVKGVTGGALLGAELVMAIEAAFDVQPAWAYVVGGLGGAVGGGIGGYFVEQEGNPRTTMLMLGAGMAFIIPTTVAVLSATAYEPPADYLQDQPPADEPVAEPPRPVDAPAPPAPPAAPPTSPPGDVPPSTDPAPTPGDPPSGTRAPSNRSERLSLRMPPPALIGIDPRAVTLNVPAIELHDVYTPVEQLTFGAPQATEVRFPLLNFIF
jgi:hypothetical protein